MIGRGDDRKRSSGDDRMWRRIRRKEVHAIYNCNDEPFSIRLIYI